MPKTELHLHLDGSMRPKSAWEMAAERGIRLGAVSRAELDEMMRKDISCGSLLDYLNAFGVPLKILQDEGSLERTTYELIEALSGDNVVYAEIRFAPQLHTNQGLTQRQAVEAVLSGCRRGEKDFPDVISRVILCVMAGADPKLNRKENFLTVEVASDYIGKGVAAVDLAGGEGLSPIGEYREFFIEAERLKIPYTVHAGEACGPENIKEAVSWGARRIGHGCRAVESPEIMRVLKSEGITLEICPTSNVHTKAQPSYREHSVRALFDYGIRICINTDNRTVSNIDLDKEYTLLRDIFNFTKSEFLQMNRNAVNAAFIGEDVKRILLDKYFKT